jgi:hypothetical protein
VLVFLSLLSIVGMVFIAMAPQARARLREVVLASIIQLKHEAARSRPDIEEFREALRARTRWAFVTPALIAVNVTVFVLMLGGAGALGDPATLAGWGGNYWLGTRNGEWWRLVTSIFVHAGMFHLLVNIAGLTQIGLILERLVGRVIVTRCFYSGVFAVPEPHHASAGHEQRRSGGFGLYGLVLASSIWGCHRRQIPLRAATRLVPAAGVHPYNLARDSLERFVKQDSSWAFCARFLTRGVSERSRWCAGRVMAAAVVMAVKHSAAGVTDVKPDRTNGRAEDSMAGVPKAAGHSSAAMTAEACRALLKMARSLIWGHRRTPEGASSACPRT